MTTATRKGVGRQEKSPHVDYTDALGHINTAPHTRQKADSVYRPHYESIADPALVAAQAHIDAAPTNYWLQSREWPDFYNRETFTVDAAAVPHWPTHASRAWFLVATLSSAAIVLGFLGWLFL
jgi:hypothetical protein